MKIYFPWYCLPSPAPRSEYSFSRRPASSCYWDQFHNAVQALHSTTFYTCIHEENSVRLCHQHLSKFYGCAFEYDGKLPLPGCRYPSPGCNDFRAVRILPADLNHDSWVRVYNDYGPPGS